MIMEATPTENNLALRLEGFSSLAEALDYAAWGKTGYNFYNGKGELDVVMPYARLRDEARQLAYRLLGLELERGARVAIVADTHPDFVRFFFATRPGAVLRPRFSPLQGLVEIMPSRIASSHTTDREERIYFAMLWVV